MSDHDDTVETGSGNVFADLGLPRADERLQLAERARQMPAALPEGWRWCINPACPMYATPTAAPLHAHQRTADAAGHAHE